MRRTLVCLAVLLLAPLAAYWNTVFHEYGFRDDYAHLREVHEEPGKLFKFTSSNGRPVYGVLLEASVAPLRGVADLPWLRLAGVLLLTACGAALWWQLRRSGWSDYEALGIAAAVPLLPAAQITASWAIAWPLALAALLSIAGFALIEARLAHPGRQRTAAVLGGGALYFAAGLIYQSNALFAVVPLAAALLLRRGGGVLTHLRWGFTHLAILFVSLAAGFLLMALVFKEGVVAESARMSFETNIGAKLLWFVREALANALALFALRDRYNTGAWLFWSAAVGSVAVIACGWRFGSKSWSHRVRWLVCVAFLPFVAHGVSLASAAWVIGYRTLLTLTGLVLVLVMFGLRSLRLAGRIEEPRAHAAIAALLAVAVISAAYNTYALIAVPQNREWTAMREAADRITPEVDTSVYIIKPTLGVRATRRSYSDEFGSLSSDSDWVPQEMFKTAMRERFPAGVPPECRFTLTASREAPDAAAEYDAVIDLRRFRDESADPPPGFAVSIVPHPELCPMPQVASVQGRQGAAPVTSRR
jgi:hypothetical protein